MTKLKQFDWFYLALAVFMVALPFSEALISISGVLLLIVSFFQINKHTPLTKKIRSRKDLLLFSSIYLVYVIGFIFCSDLKWGIYDLQKNIPYLIIPLAFILGKQISEKQLIRLLKLFALAVLAAAIITVVNFYLNDEKTILKAQEFGYIHHIRFSLQIVLVLIIYPIFFLTNKLKQAERIFMIPGMIFLVLFLIWHQSLTGIITFLGVAFFGIIILFLKFDSRFLKAVSIFSLALLIMIPVACLYHAVHQYYQTDQVDFKKLEELTSKGNPYHHDLKNSQIENGHYVGLYWNEDEMREAWNNRGILKYEETDQYGFKVKYTLVRYLSSKNLRKDADGVNLLSEKDIQNIEAGISNYLLAQKGLSLYPRLYVSIWELDHYFKTGYANGQSISQRIEYAKAALLIMKEHFWFGVGTGNWENAYRDAYERNQSQMDPARYAGAHNQYLNYMVKFGFVGLLWILFAIVYPVVKTGTYKNPLFFLFLISLLIANMGDSNFETHEGSSFFILFYCLFISEKKWNSAYE